MAAGKQMAEVAALVGDPGRASIFAVMMDGGAHAAGEFAVAAGVTAATASGQLAWLRYGRLVAVAAKGRHCYYRLASTEVARMLEGTMVVTREPEPRARATPRVPDDLREARTCYDHLARRLGVAIAGTLVADGAVRLANGNGEITERGRDLLASLAIDLDAARGRSCGLLCRPCLDWSERRPHLAGVLGAALLDRFLDVDLVQMPVPLRHLAYALDPLPPDLGSEQRSEPVHRSRTFSWQMSMPRSSAGPRRSTATAVSTCIITTSRITSGELLK